VRFSGADFSDLLERDCDQSITAIEAVIFDHADADLKLLRQVLTKLTAPAIALVENRNIERTRALYQSGIDDVVLKPVHHEELLLRIATLKRRMLPRGPYPHTARLCVYFDGRDPEFDGEKIDLPRRQRKILEFLVSIDGRRVTRSQIFDAVYGIYDENFAESVVESHISRLRKKLRRVTGSDPINSRRFLGYQLDLSFVFTCPDVDYPMVA